MSSKFLDKTGLDTLWAKIKSTFQTLGNLVTAWGSTPSDTKYPSEKLVKDSLDGKVSVSDVKNASWGVNILCQSFQAKNGTTVDNTNKTITATYDTSKSTDIYCHATTSVPIVSGETYTISFDVIESNLTEGQYWEWGFFGQNHAVFRITGTGHYSKTLVSDINRSVGYSALIDDSGKRLSNGSYIVMKNIKYEIGPFETKYSDLDSLLVTGSNALSTTLGPMIRALVSWSNPAEGEFIPAASGSSQGRYTLRKIFDFFKSLMVSDSGVNISGNAGTATTAAGYTSGGAIDTALQGKVDKETGKGLSTNDFTTAEKNKLAGIASGAEVNVQSDWNQVTTTADDYIKNKPQNLVQDASYVHTDNNYTTADKDKVASAVQPDNAGLTDYYEIEVTTSTGGVVDNDTYAAISASISAGRMVYLKLDDMPLYRYLETDHGNIWFASPYETVMLSPTAGTGGHEFTLEPLADNNLNSISVNSVQNKIVKAALDGKQDDLGISSSGDAGKFLNMQGSWQVPVKSLQYWSGGSTSIKGVYIGTCTLQDGWNAWITGTMSLTNYHNSNPSTPSNKGIALGNFYLWAVRYGNTVTASCRLYSLNARHTNTDLMLVYKRDTSDTTRYKVHFYVCFGPGTIGGGTATNQRPFGLGICYLENHNADIPSALTGITSDIQYDDDYYTVHKMPYLGQDVAGVGSETGPVYVKNNGEIVPCSGSLNRAYCSTSPPVGLTKDNLSDYDTFILPSGSNPSINVSDLVVDRPYKFFINGASNSNFIFKISFGKGTLSSYVVYNKGSSSTKTGSYGYSESIRSQPLIVVRSVSGSTNSLFIVGY
ncbi:hypothetical protein [Fibrobacter sp.]|uniref:hypothetical protein n=1 Tax=Fibrobacter sp. TaxID=35828 RepID=UPI00388DACF6